MKINRDQAAISAAQTQQFTEQATQLAEDIRVHVAGVILAIASEATQRNLAAVQAALLFDASQSLAFRDGVEWINAVRAKARNWPWRKTPHLPTHPIGLSVRRTCRTWPRITRSSNRRKARKMNQKDHTALALLGTSTQILETKETT